jgi:hypothetical protein
MKLNGDKLGASDGDIGHVKDVFFDDQNWAVRYVVADTGSWLPGRQVLLSPHAFGGLHQDSKYLVVKLTRKQIEQSPSIESHKPVSRQYEAEYYRYYGLPYYWQGSGLWGMSGFPIVQSPDDVLPGEPIDELDMHSQRADAHLRSARDMHGYHIKRGAESIGQLSDFLMDDKCWAIQELVIKTGHWLSGREVSISTSAVERISFEESTVFVNVTKEDVEKAPGHPPV